MPQRDDDITPAVLLSHMQGMQRSLENKIDGVEQSLGSRIDGVEQRLTHRIDVLEVKVDRNHAQTILQLDNIDARLDDLEVIQIPQIKKTVGMR